MRAPSKEEKEWLRKIKGTPKRQHGLTSESEPMSPSEPSPVEAIGPGLSVQEKSSTTEAPTLPARHGLEDVAGMEELKRMVKEDFINVLNNRECAKAYGVHPPSLLFYGPTGCGKTFFAEKIAEEVGVNFIKVVPDDLASTLVHGTQEKIGELFRKAARQAPTLIFFDEFDAMVPHRSNDDHSHQNGETNEFLCMLNNASSKGIYVLAATNHPERIDKAVLRTGRIDEVIYIDMPDKSVRESLFRLELSKLPSADDIDHSRLAELTDGYTCSDISYVIKKASRQMFNASIAEKDKPYKKISQALLEEMISIKSPSLSKQDLKEFERIRREFSPDAASSMGKPSIGFM